MSSPHPSGRRASALLLLAAFLAGPAAAAEPPAPKAVARAILSAEDYQREPLPGQEVVHEPRRWRPGHGGEGAGATGRSLGLLLAWLGAGLFTVLGACALGAWAWRRARLAHGAGPAATAAEAGAALAVPARAERLAAAGRYQEALRALLAEGIGALAGRATLEVPAAWTGREAARCLPASPVEALALRELVRLVEDTLFGGREAGRAEYARGLSALKELRP